MEQQLKPEDYLQLLRDKLIKLLYYKNMSEQELSFILDRNRSYINKVTSGKMKPSMTEFLKICEALDTNPAYFFDPDISNPALFSDTVRNLKQLDEPDLELINSLSYRLKK